MVAEDMGDSYNRCSQIADASIEIEEIIKDLSEAELRDEKVFKVVLKNALKVNQILNLWRMESRLIC